MWNTRTKHALNFYNKATFWHKAGTKPVLHLTSPSCAGLVIPALQAYKSFCFVSLIIPVILQRASTNVQGQSSH